MSQQLSIPEQVAKAEQNCYVCTTHRPEGLAALRAEVAEGSSGDASDLKMMLEVAVDRCIHKETSSLLSQITAAADRGIVPRPAWPPEIQSRVNSVSLEHSGEESCAFCSPEELTGRAADMEAGLL
jgi:hypothetical protein